jgi:threonine/homoserine/homoserine lactone efflux protein
MVSFMEPDLFIRGFMIGLSIAVPVGPIGVLCIRRTLAEGRLRGLVTGLGAATGDATYGGVAAFGLTAISGALIGQQSWLRLIGGAALIYLGAKTSTSRPPEKAAEAKGGSLAVNYLSTLALTVTNPLTILMFTAVFAGFGVAPTGLDQAATVTLGVFLGSGSWWVILTLLVGLLRGRFDARWMRWGNILSGLVIAGFGLWSLTQLIMG